jgi:hypothetical protein
LKPVEAMAQLVAQMNGCFVGMSEEMVKNWTWAYLRLVNCFCRSWT